MDGWMDGFWSRVKDCLQQSKIQPTKKYLLAITLIEVGMEGQTDVLDWIFIGLTVSCSDDIQLVDE